MNIKEIALDGFRNYEGFSAAFSPDMNVITGENAQGKTNLMEAIGYLSGAKSHRTRLDRDLILFHRDEGLIRAQLESRGRDFSVEIALRKNHRRAITVNHVKLKKAGELSGLFHTVLFCPEDLSLVREGAAERRRFLDTAISQLRPKYADALTRYQRCLDHKNRILRDYWEKPGLLSVLEDFNQTMAVTGALIIHYRANFIRRLLALSREIQREFSGGREDLNLIYETVKTVEDPLAAPSAIYPQLVEHQKLHEEAELRSRSCLSGPHKDDMVAEIDGKAARQFASQGQTRTVALSLKLAERMIHREATEQWPVLLLDDVLSELDQKRQDFVLEHIQGGQVFITGCEVPQLRRPEARVLTIADGTLLE